VNDFELDWLKRWNQYSPKNIALKDGDTGREVSYSKLFAAANQGAEFLSQKYSIRRGDRIALLATNELESVFLFFALQRLGATLVPINFRLTKREVDHIVRDSDPSLIIAQEAFWPLIEDYPQAKLRLQGPASFAEAVAQNKKAAELPFLAQAEDAALLLYTSGTTGAPKGALLSHRMIFWNSINTTLRLNISQSDSTAIFLPFFHTGGWNVLTTPFLHRGAKVVFLKKFDADQILQVSADEKCTLLFGVPTTMEMMARSPLFKSADLSSLRYAIVGGEPMPVDLIRVWDQKKIPIRQGYGLTEFGPNVFSLNEEDAIRKIGSIGYPNFYIDIQIVGDHGRPVARGEVGELILRGPMMMTGYWKNPKATAETIRDGWFYTGDLVRQDEDGFVYVVGRKKDMFISGGENVYPPEVEQVLRQMGQIREVAVIGVADPKWGEVGKAFIVKRQDVTVEEIQAHCLKNLAKYKIPKHFAFIQELPKGDSGKILKRKLQESAPSEHTET
jgi:fatty-acyl-CoA synthase